MSRDTMAALRDLGIPFDDYLRLPTLVKEDDFRSAHHVVAVKQAEHEPMIERQFPTWLDRVEFWHIHDLDCWGPEEAIPSLNREVAGLVERLMRELTMSTHAGQQEK
jgi:protein-tyrosine phosphatase